MAHNTQSRTRNYKAIAARKTAMKAAADLRYTTSAPVAIVIPEPEFIVKDGVAEKWLFDFNFGGSLESRTEVRSGCVGAETREEAEDMIRRACPAESFDDRLRLSIVSDGLLDWPRRVS